MEKKQILSVIAENLRDLMNRKQLSNVALARKCKVATGTISKIINGDMSVSVPIVAALAEGLEVDLSELLKGIAVKKANAHDNAKLKIKDSDRIFMGILSINNKRFTCIKDYSGNVIGTSELEGGLDLTETSGNLIQSIRESIDKALPKVQNNDAFLKYATLNLVPQSYEFEDTRHKFIHFAKRYFKDVLLLPDWQITYLATFKKNDGISLVTDKGVSLSYMHNGTLKKLGGWKFPVYDLGGENWLGVETIRHTIEAAEGYTPMSALAHNVLAKFNGKIEKITETCFKGAKNDDIYCLFAESLLKSYFIGDKAAKEIIDRGFKAVYKGIAKVDEILGKKVKITINGSLTDIYKGFFKKERLVTSSSDAEKAKLLADVTKDYLETHGINIH